MGVKPGKKGLEKYLQEGAHTTKIYKHGHLKILFTSPAFPSTPN